MQVIAPIVSTLALVTSLVTVWLTIFRGGTVKMTQPSVIFLGPDSGPREDQKPKVYLRTLLFATGKKGRVIESMYVSLRRNESKQNFSVWVNGDDRLSRGSGLFVGETGVIANHHFLTPRDDNSFRFQEGTYVFEVFAKLINEASSRKLFSHDLVISRDQSNALASSNAGIYFDWSPETEKYLSHVDVKPERGDPSEALAREWFLKDLLRVGSETKEDLRRNAGSPNDR